MYDTAEVPCTLLLVFYAHFLRARGDWARYSNIMQVNNKDMLLYV